MPAIGTNCRGKCGADTAPGAKLHCERQSEVCPVEVSATEARRRAEGRVNMTPGAPFGDQDAHRLPSPPTVEVPLFKMSLQPLMKVKSVAS